MEKPKNLKEFLASLDFKDCYDNKESKTINYKLLEEKLKPYKSEIERYKNIYGRNYESDGLYRILADNANYKLCFDSVYFTLSKITSPFSPSAQVVYFLEDFLLDYINLYKEVFKDEIKNLGKADPKLKQIFDELPNKIKQANKDPDKLTVWRRFALSLIGTICSFSLLFWLDKDVNQTLKHPIIKTRLLKVQNTYEKSLKQIEKIKDKQKSKTDNERN